MNTIANAIHPIIQRHVDVNGHHSIVSTNNIASRDYEIMFSAITETICTEPVETREKQYVYFV